MPSLQDSFVFIFGSLALLAIAITGWPQKKAKLPFVKPEDFQISTSIDFREPSNLRWNKLFKLAAQKLQAPFRVQMSGGFEPIVLPPKYIDEIKSHKDFSFDVAMAEAFPTYVPGFKPMSYLTKNSTIIHRALRRQMTQNLANFTEDLSAEAQESLPDLFPIKQDWQEAAVQASMLDLVTRLSTRVFLGRNLKQREQWHKIASTYSMNMFQAQRVLMQWKSWLRPFVQLFMPEFHVIKRQMHEAAAIIEPEVKARRERRQRGETDDEEIKTYPDSVDWFEEARQGKDFDFVIGQLMLAVVAIDTTTHTLANAILDIASQPALTEDIRKEIITIINEDGGLKKTTLSKAKLLDSAIKESQRLHPLDQALLLRVATKDITFKDGTEISKSETVFVGPLPQFDPEIYPDPYTYDGYRFFKLRQQPSAENKWQLAATQTEHIGFGHGIHACPGRFLASNEMKVALMHMLMKYEWKLRDGEQRPKDLEFDSAPVADPSAKLLYKARTAEVEF